MKAQILTDLAQVSEPISVLSFTTAHSKINSSLLYRHRPQFLTPRKFLQNAVKMNNKESNPILDMLNERENSSVCDPRLLLLQGKLSLTHTLSVGRRKQRRKSGSGLMPVLQRTHRELGRAHQPRVDEGRILPRMVKEAAQIVKGVRPGTNEDWVKLGRLTNKEKGWEVVGAATEEEVLPAANIHDDIRKICRGESVQAVAEERGVQLGVLTREIAHFANKLMKEKDEAAENKDGWEKL